MDSKKAMSERKYDSCLKFLELLHNERGWMRSFWTQIVFATPPMISGIIFPTLDKYTVGAVLNFCAAQRQEKLW